MLGRCAGILFMAGAVASAPANEFLTHPEPAWYMHLIDLLGAISGVVCYFVPWQRIRARWLHVIPFVATGEIVLTVTALGVHGDVYLWFFVLGAVFTGYAFQRRRYVALHMSVAGLGFFSTAVYGSGWNHDALVQALVGIPTLWVAAGVVCWLREGLEARERALLELACTDALTGLGNRRALVADLEAAVAPGEPPRVFAIFDLDGFKAYNDRHGHPAGDTLLEQLGARLGAAMAGRGRAYRLGGDEFCVLVDDGSGQSAIVAAIRALTEGAISPSHGAATIPAEARSATAALSTADARMYAAKGRRRVSRPVSASVPAPSPPRHPEH